MKIYTISPVHPITGQRIGAVYMTTFATLWLFIEPLGTFGLFPSLGIASASSIYALLLFFPALTLPAFLLWHRWHRNHDLPFIKFRVRSSADGATYHLKVAENLQVAEVLRQYIEILKRGPARNQVEATSARYYPVLQVKRGDAYLDVDGRLTVHAAGLTEGDECQVRAQEYTHTNRVMFCRKASE